MNQKTIIGNVCFIKNEKGNKVLLLKRSREPMANMFTGVGGKTNFDEDINSSCIREVKEETGLNIKNVKLKGVLKTVLEGKDSSWILFVYTAETPNIKFADCTEGELQWVDLNKINSYQLIGFIKRILPSVLKEKEFVEGLIKHDIKGNVLEEKINVMRFES